MKGVIPMKPATATIVRVVLLVVSLINMALAMLGIVPEEIVGDGKAYEIGSIIVTAVVSIINMWENNSFTPEAIEADKYLNELLKKKQKVEEGIVSDDATSDDSTGES